MSNFYFGNLIIENKRFSQSEEGSSIGSTFTQSTDNVQKSSTYNYYLGKINDPKTNLRQLKQYILDDTSDTLSREEKRDLLSKIDPILIQQKQDAEDIESGKLSPYDKGVKDLIDFNDRLIKEIGVNFLEGGPSLMSQEQTPEQLLRSYDAQYRKALERIGKIKTLYRQLLFNPNTISGLMTIASVDEKYIKTAEKEIESDKVYEDYMNELFMQSKDPVPWGTIVYEKPKHKTKTIDEEQELHRKKTSKFKIIKPEV